MRIVCYFHERMPMSRCSMWRFGWVTDKHEACPAGLGVVVGLENELFVPEACGRVEVFDDCGGVSARSELLRCAMRAGYGVRLRRSVMGPDLQELGTRVGPFVVHENSLLALTQRGPFQDLLLSANRVYEGDDGELYVQDPSGRWFHYIDENLLARLQDGC
jgi:hypothetical protein